MKILYTTGRELDYPRNRLIHTLLTRQHQVRYIGRQSGKKSILLQSLHNCLSSTPFLLSKENHLSIVGFYGHLIMLWAGLFARQPILFDAFVSTYDTLCLDRKKFKEASIPGRLARWLDQRACSKAAGIILDTQAHADFFQQTFHISPGKIDVLYVGCDETVFSPIAEAPAAEPTVLFYGSFLPLHGLEIILQAASALQDTPVRFQLIGPVQELRDRFPGAFGLRNLEILPPVPLSQLPAYIQNAAVCLGGHFGASAKAGRVIAGKTYQCMAMGKATLVGENPANHELFTHGADAWFCKMNDAPALAEAILFLINQPELRARLGQNARRTFLEKASLPILAEKLDQIIRKTEAR